MGSSEEPAGGLAGGPGRIITSPDCLAEGAAWLAARDPVMAGILGAVGPLPLRRRDDGFAALLDVILGQQVSVASARALAARLAGAGLCGETAVAAADEAALRACGLSRQKVAELAPQAREAERVRLRGRVATAQLSEEMKKLAVGRAYAVKVEFVKHEVDKSKIRILSPQQSSGENATGSVRGVDVMIDMPERKTLSGTVKDGA
ncbi:MAG: hypothetical protein CVT84_16940 [Alphaproteobacteria bacterium HGW-Alphaproteobacteria-6]|nr:MAG: hypothetical protein CVT84_16940 [Alphaproteobacteria bacterium HGW-Alphaproteobacteria-6]